MFGRKDAEQHPLEALYQARDAIWRATSHAHRDGLPADERTSYEHAVRSLQQAVTDLRDECELPTAFGSEGAHLAPPLEIPRSP